MQGRFSWGVLIAVALLALSLGTVSGGIAGGIVANFVSSSDATDTDEPTPVSTPVIADVTEPAEPTPTVEAETPTPPVAETAAQTELSVVEIVEKVTPGVVTVINRQQSSGFFGAGELEPAGTGTGFVIDDQGHIVTNNHVVEGSEEIDVIFADGTEMGATLLGGDQFADLAVIRLDEPAAAPLTLGDSDALRPGERIIAIGSALGDFRTTVTEGIISATGRELQTPEGFNMENMIQHDASINPGNSGGPLINMQGEVVGVNTAVVRSAGLGVTAEGLGFAIPSNTVREMAEQLITDGQITRPYIGIAYETLTRGVAQANDLPIDHGIIVREVSPGSPAEAAGIQVNDVITHINGDPIDLEHPLVNALFNYQVGETVQIDIYRVSTGETLTVDLTLAARPDNP